jgi:hypothetical protein
MKKTKLHLVLLFTIILIKGYSQTNITCSNSIQTCLEAPTTLDASVGVTILGPDIACLEVSPNPAWFSFKVQQSGRINITVSSNPLKDLDFACWGPFAADNVVGLNNSNYCSLLKIDTLSDSHGSSFGPNPTSFGVYPIGNLVDCSYSTGANEYIHIPNATADEWYLILVTNYSNLMTAITMTSDTSSIGTSDCGISMPILSVNQSVMNGLSYYTGSGPSSAQSFNLSGIHLTNNPSPITLSSPMDYEVSLNPDTGFTSFDINISYPGDTLPSMPIYVRLKAGLMPNDYNNQMIIISREGADTVKVTCNGNVVNAPTITLNTDSLFGFEYDAAAGPSNVQSYNLSGIDLIGFPSYVTVTAPSSYEVSLSSGSGFGDTINIPYLSATIMQTLIYVRLKEGLNVGTYDEQITNAGSGAQLQYVFCSGSVVLPEAVSDHSKNGPFEVSPNPASDILNCTFETSINRTLSIVDVFGKIVKSWESNLQNESIDVKILSNGIYFLKAEEENRSYSRKFIIRRD